MTDHDASDDCGVEIFGAESDKFWHDRKGALLNAVRIRTGIERADVLVVCFGEKYRQWNAAFDAGYAAALGKPIIVLRSGARAALPGHRRPLRQVAAIAGKTRAPDRKTSQAGAARLA